jgi:hypothetical protein
MWLEARLLGCVCVCVARRSNSSSRARVRDACCVPQAEEPVQCERRTGTVDADKSVFLERCRPQRMRALRGGRNEVFLVFQGWVAVSYGGGGLLATSDSQRAHAL